MSFFQRHFIKLKPGDNFEKLSVGRAICGILTKTSYETPDTALAEESDRVLRLHQALPDSFLLRRQFFKLDPNRFYPRRIVAKQIFSQINAFIHPALSSGSYQSSKASLISFLPFYLSWFLFMIFVFIPLKAEYHQTRTKHQTKVTAQSIPRKRIFS